MASVNDDEDKPLDPAAERVRRRLARFMAINLGILFVAVMAVVAAIVYKLGNTGETAPKAANGTAQPPSGEGVAEGIITLPEGGRITGHSLSGNRLILDAALQDGRAAIFIYDIAERRMVGRFEVGARP